MIRQQSRSTRRVEAFGRVEAHGVPLGYFISYHVNPVNPVPPELRAKDRYL
jgi:hypothetical protein